MSDDAGQDSVEEELRAGGSRPTARIVLLVAVVVIAALVFVVIQSHSGSPSGRAAASASPQRHAAVPTRTTRTPESGVAAALVPGRLRGFSLVHGRIVYAAELVNATGAKLRVKYPIRLAATSPTTAMVSFAELTDSKEPFSPGQPPPLLTQIAAHQHVTLQIELHVRCQAVPRPLAWPTGGSTIPIDLAGYSTPAVFTFADLFGFNVRAGLQRACRVPAG